MEVYTDAKKVGKDLTADNKSFLESYLNQQFTPVILKFFSTDISTHGTIISKEDLEASADTIYDKPIVWKYDLFKDDASTHQSNQIPIGFVPRQSNPVEILFDEECQEYFIYVKAVIWNGYSQNFLSVLEKHNLGTGENSLDKHISVETLSIKTPQLDGTIRLTNLNYTGITVLGEHVLPSVKGAIIKCFTDSTVKWVEDGMNQNYPNAETLKLLFASIPPEKNKNGEVKESGKTQKLNEEDEPMEKEAMEKFSKDFMQNYMKSEEFAKSVEKVFSAIKEKFAAEDELKAKKKADEKIKADEKAGEKANSDEEADKFAEIQSKFSQLELENANYKKDLEEYKKKELEQDISSFLSKFSELMTPDETKQWKDRLHSSPSKAELKLEIQNKMFEAFASKIKDGVATPFSMDVPSLHDSKKSEVNSLFSGI